MCYLRLLLLVCSLIFIGGLTGCNDDKEKENAVIQNGRLRVAITDAPFPIDIIEEAKITINKITIKSNNGDQNVLTLFDGEIDLNLLDLTGGVTEQLANVELPVGQYSQLRLFVSEASLLLKTGEFFEVKVPSGSQSGIKVSIKPSVDVESQISSDVLLDVDVSKSFILQGNINTPAGIKGFNFKPVIKAVNLSMAGRLTGSVTSDKNNEIQGAEVSVYADDTLNTTSFTQSDGSYTVIGLIAGTYQLQAAKEGYATSELIDVEIFTANKTMQDIILEEE